MVGDLTGAQVGHGRVFIKTDTELFIVAKIIGRRQPRLWRDGPKGKHRGLISILSEHFWQRKSRRTWPAERRHRVAKAKSREDRVPKIKKNWVIKNGAVVSSR